MLGKRTPGSSQHREYRVRVLPTPGCLAVFGDVMKDLLQVGAVQVFKGIGRAQVAQGLGALGWRSVDRVEQTPCVNR